MIYVTGRSDGRLFYGAMAQRSLRLVVQQVQTGPRYVYRLVAYATSLTFNHVEFDSLEDLLKIVDAAIPDFDFSELDLSITPGTQVLFSNGMSLSDEQIRVLDSKCPLASFPPKRA